VHLVRLDPTVGSEVRKTRPCLIVSPDELNEHLRTSHCRAHDDWRSCVPVANCLPISEPLGFRGALDQVRTVDGERLVKRLGQLSSGTTTAVLDALQETFEE
jgi:mRNA interferase MazF